MRSGRRSLWLAALEFSAHRLSWFFPPRAVAAYPAAHHGPAAVSGSLEESVAKRLPEEAEAVRTVFARYLELGSMGGFGASRRPQLPRPRSSPPPDDHDHARMDRAKLRGREGHCSCALRKTGNEARKPDALLTAIAK